jgi:hypothetical protein
LKWNLLFGIISNLNTSVYLEEVIESVRSQKIENYEILIVGDQLDKYSSWDTVIINFDDKSKKPWISKKKNLITQNAKYENIVYLHDYIKLDENWYKGYVNFNKEFKVCINPIINKDGSRYRDWTLFYKNNTRFDKFLVDTGSCLLPYTESRLSKYMYISGAYWVAKKDFMAKNPLDNKRFWGDSEDVEWSFRVRKQTNFVINTQSTVSLLKYKDPLFKLIDYKDLDDFINYVSSYRAFVDRIKLRIKKISNTILTKSGLNFRYNYFDINKF